MNKQATFPRLLVSKAHKDINIQEQELVKDVWEQKYKAPTDTCLDDTITRVAEAICPGDVAVADAMRKFLWIPAGRIWSSAGTEKVTTMMNCYVSRTIHDSMSGIADALKDAMLTLQQGGGIGMDFSTLRPAGAHLERTGSVASGPLPFMDMWDSMCATIKSAGDRRGAMMGVLHCEHPDLTRFIQAKHTAGRLTNFNVSVLVTDAFMDAVKQDEDWFLGFHIPRHDKQHVTIVEKDDGTLWYVYEVWRARDLWNMILHSTYEYSEPGVIFVDRINDTNNMAYVESISCTNPCGEQPLPPNGCCNLGAVNLARMVRNPFGVTGKPMFDLSLLKNTVAIGVRFLDNVIERTNYPVEAQRHEELTKRRLGLGVTGLANALAFMKIPYSSELAHQQTRTIMYTIMVAAYEASHKLALEKGSFPLFDNRQWAEHSPIFANLPPKLQKNIRSGGIRNGVLLTIAPTGTTSILAGNVSSGLEPVFAHEMQRKVLQADDSHKEYTAYDYGALLYKKLHPDHKGSIYPSYMETAEELLVRSHLDIQAICQEYVDASISKTINCPEHMSFSAFEDVYDYAYKHGCKGCTTYRPSEVRGSILSTGSSFPSASTNISTQKPAPRPETLEGKTHKLKWFDTTYYVTINEQDGSPSEIFISSPSSKYSDWSTALSLMISAIMRRGDDISFIPDVLQKVVSATESGFVGGKYYGSLVALVGETIEKHIGNQGDISTVPMNSQVSEAQDQTRGEICWCSRGVPAVFYAEGCKRCAACGDSTCG